jgi:hypothetical protein
MGTKRRRGRIEPTDEWEQIELLCGWPEQREYELIRPLVLFGSPAAERALETSAASERTLQRRAARFDAEGMESLFGSEHARRTKLPPAIRRRIVDLKAEYPSFNLNEIANAVYVCFGRRPETTRASGVSSRRSPCRSLRMVRRYPPYHEIPEGRERRAAVVTLHAEGWSAKAIAGYLTRYTSVHRPPRPEALGRGRARGATRQAPRPAARRPQGRPEGHRGGEAPPAKSKPWRLPGARGARPGRHLPQPSLLRAHPRPKNRKLYGLEKPKGPSEEKREMPFRATRRHQFWSAGTSVTHRRPRA